VDTDKLRKIIDLHIEWLKSNGINGKKANFSRINLCNIKFEKLNLEKADFSYPTLIDGLCNLFSVN